MTIDAVNAISITLFDETLGKDTSDPLGITINRSHLDWYRTGDRTDPPIGDESDGEYLSPNGERVSKSRLLTSTCHGII